MMQTAHDLAYLRSKKIASNWFADGHIFCYICVEPSIPRKLYRLPFDKRHFDELKTWNRLGATPMFNRTNLSRTFFVVLFSLFICGALSVNVRATEGDDRAYDEYDTTARVARISFLDGEVSLHRADSDGWERATANMPLVEGDTLATGRDGRFEIQIDGRKFIRLGVYSSLTINTLRDNGIAFSLAEGTATVRLARFDRDKEYFEIDAPNATFAAQRTGLYRIDVTPAENRDDKAARVQVTVRDKFVRLNIGVAPNLFQVFNSSKCRLSNGRR